MWFCIGLSAVNIFVNIVFIKSATVIAKLGLKRCIHAQNVKIRRIAMEKDVNIYIGQNDSVGIYTVGSKK